MIDDQPRTTAKARQHIQEVKNENKNKSSDLARAAEMLRKGMFPERVRFFLELLQNASDAAEEDESCEVDIRITDKYVLVQNDARLFTKQDVKQLCGVGRTHKRFDPDYVGYWGFGFKSVFRVTEEPYIISPPYQFKFDRDADEWGDDDEIAWVITPLWVEDDELPDAIKEVETEEKNTFILPLKRRGQETYRKEIVADIQDRVDDILMSELPLFLPGLKTVQIRNEVADEERTITATVKEKRVHGEIVETDDGTRWWVYREKHTVPDVIRDHPETEEWNREMVDTREIVIGVGINEDGHLESRHLGPRAAIYSFTPLGHESVGLPFLLQGDFLAEAGRRTADKDVRWNHWLAEKAGETVVRAAQHLMDDEEWCVGVYDALVPDRKVDHHLFGGHDRREAWPGLDAKADDDRTAWAGTDAVIVEWFSDNPTILTESGEYRRPENVRFAEDSDVRNSQQRIRSLISSTDLEQLAGASYVATEVRESWRSRTQERLLGHSGKLHTGTVRNLIKENPDWLRSKAQEAGAVEWFATLYAVLEEEIQARSSSTESRRRQALADVPLVLTEEGLIAPSDDTTIVIPTRDDEAEVILRKVGQTIDAVRVHPHLADDSSSRRFLKRFDIDEVDAEWAVEEAVLPRINDTDTSADRVVDLTPYVRSHLGAGYNTEGMSVATKNGDTAPANEVWFADPYDPSYDIEMLFGADHRYLSDTYHKQYEWNAEWRKFFEEIGVTSPGETRDDLLQALAALPSSSTDNLRKRTARLYRLLLHKFESLPTSTRVEKIGGEIGVPLLAEDGEFYPARNLFIPDDDAVRQAFADSDKITFAWPPSSDRVDAEEERILDLMKRLGAQSTIEAC